MAWINVQAIARIGLDQRDLPVGKKFLVLGQVARIDGVEQFVAGVGITMAGRPACRRAGHAAIPGRNAAIGIAGLFGADRRQFTTQFAEVSRCRHRHLTVTKERQQRATQQRTREVSHERLLEGSCYVLL